LTTTFRTDTPGGAVVVTKAGSTVFKKAYGMADLELSVPTTVDMVYAIGSMTKQFTAVSILMLAEEGKLGIRDDIRMYVPEYDTRSDTITIEHLLTHTAGIVDLFEIPEWLDGLKTDVSPRQLLDYFIDRPLLFKPGEGHHYSNAGYVLLGMVIERASGQTYDEFLRTRVFEPLGMGRTRVGSNTGIMAGRLRGYSLRDGTFENAGYFSITQQFAGGSIWSCVGDLARWNTGLLSGKLLSRESLKKAFTASVLKDGKGTGYGFGWNVDEFLGQAVVRHGGSSLGFKSYGMLLVDDQIYIAVLTNSHPMEGERDTHDPETIAGKLARIMLGKPVADAALTPIELDEETLDAYVGVYEENENDYRVVTRKGRQLYQKKTGFGKDAIYPLSQTEFFWDGPGRLEFVISEQGEVTHANWRSEDGKLYVGKRTNLSIPEPKHAIPMSDEQLRRFTGTYRSSFAMGFQVEVGDGCLIMRSEAFPTSTWYPESESGFFLADQDDVTIAFSNDERGEVNGFVMYRNGKEFMVTRTK
jgi:CubicO group peptidase (beta-lactamase class C family)